MTRPISKEDLDMYYRLNIKRLAYALMAAAAVVAPAAAASTHAGSGPNHDAKTPERTPGQLEPITIRSAAGDVVGVYTDARQGLPPLPLNAIEQEKFARAREAVVAAEAAGTRWITPPERPEVIFGDDAAAQKLERRSQMEPQVLRKRMGVPSGEQEVRDD